MTVRIWSSDVSAWEPKSAPSSSSSSSPPLPSRRELARIRTRHSSNVFQAFFVDPGDEGSELLTCAADGAVRVMSVPRAQRDYIARAAAKMMKGSAGLPVGVQVAFLPFQDEMCLHVMKQQKSH